MKDRLFEIWFSLKCQPASKEFRSVLARFGTAYDVYNAEATELDQLDCSPKLKLALADKSLSEAHSVNEYCKANGVGVLFWTDEHYPSTLRSLQDPPALLYYRGRLPAFGDRLCIGVVGTRSMSEYGKRMAYKIGYELAAVGTVVISGMALGVDAMSAAGAMAAEGTAVAVIGSGFEQIYPREHTVLYEQIIRNGGCVITEYPPASPPNGYHFPQRNRIISGLSQGTVVVECDLNSGAMITAKTAILQGREIYAFPGNVGNANAAGTNRLIRDGAAAILGARDVLVNYADLYGSALHMAKLRGAEKRSEPDEAYLLKLGVCARVSGESRETPPAASPVHTEDDTKEEKTSRPATSTPSKRPAPHRSPSKKQPDPTPASPFGDGTERILKTLTETQKKVFEALPLDHAVPVDYLTREGFSMSDIMASLTVLELKALVISLPGGLYARK